jgi:hypothetical protein
MNDNDNNEEKELIEIKITSNNTNNRNIILIITEIKEIISSSINAMKKEVVLKKIASNSLR